MVILSSLIGKYLAQKTFYGVPCKKNTVENIIGLLGNPNELDSENLSIAIVDAVKSYTRNKDVAIKVYQHFINFLKNNGVTIEIEFPAIDICNYLGQQEVH